MFEISYLNYVIRVVSIRTGWQVLVFESAESDRKRPVYRPNAVYSAEIEAIASAVEFIQRQQAFSAVWQFLYDCYDSSIITDIELDYLSASLYLFCSLKDSYSDYGYGYR
ncbi:MAG TPA: hypothetical protein V6C84_05680 [Coleofasciculaceae cyanobacterium]|jgi:hypothetical protein